jgi:hypothetical protein
MYVCMYVCVCMYAYMFFCKAPKEILSHSRALKLFIIIIIPLRYIKIRNWLRTSLRVRHGSISSWIWRNFHLLLLYKTSNDRQQCIQLILGTNRIVPRACGAIGWRSDCESKGNSGQSKTRLFWWFRVVRSLLPHFLGWLSLSAESPMVGADIKP